MYVATALLTSIELINVTGEWDLRYMETLMSIFHLGSSHSSNGCACNNEIYRHYTHKVMHFYGTYYLKKYSFLHECTKPCNCQWVTWRLMKNKTIYLVYHTQPYWLTFRAEEIVLAESMQQKAFKTAKLRGDVDWQRVAGKYLHNFFLKVWQNTLPW